MRLSSSARFSVSATGTARMPPTGSLPTSSIRRLEQLPAQTGPRRIVHQHPVLGADLVAEGTRPFSTTRRARAAAVQRLELAGESGQS